MAIGDNFRSMGSNLARGYLGTSVHRGGMKWGMEMYGLGKGMSTFGRVLGGGIGLYTAYEGYQRGGVLGAATGLASGFATSYALGAAARMLFNPVGLTALATVGAGVGAMALRKAAIDKFGDYQRRQERLEMGTPIVDNFGTVATMRRRSIAAIQSSRINGRSALGNEAGLGYTPYNILR